jgi:rSAM/selenodomain-associated transferase 2
MISVVIPAFNEAASLPVLIDAIRQRAIGYVSEIIVCDGNSTDETVEVARRAGVSVEVSPERGRARQMNAGAAKAKGDVLYFLHADTLPPQGFDTDIIAALQGEATQGGCFRLKFDHDHWFLRLNAWFTRFNIDAIRFGDQSLFVRSRTFWDIGGFREDYIVMEDQEIISRIKSKGKFQVLRKRVTTSARKYHANGIFRLQFIYFYIYALYRLGYPQSELVTRYRELVRS